MLKASRVNSWLRRVNRRFSGYSVERELLLQHVGKKLAQLLWEKRVMHAKRLMEKEKAEVTIATLTKERDEHTQVQTHLKAKLDRRQTAKRKLLVNYLSSTVLTSQLQELSTVDARAFVVASSAAEDVRRMHSVNAAGRSTGFELTTVRQRARTPKQLPPAAPEGGVASKLKEAAAPTTTAPPAAPAAAPSTSSAPPPDGDTRVPVSPLAHGAPDSTTTNTNTNTNTNADGNDTASHVEGGVVSDGTPPQTGVLDAPSASGMPAGDTQAAEQAAEQAAAGSASGPAEPVVASTPAAPAIEAAHEAARLFLAGCDLVTSEVRAIAAALYSCPNVGEVDLRANGVTDEGAAALVPFVRTSTTLTRLDLRGNYITEQGLRSLAEAARCNPRCVRVCVRVCVLSCRLKAAGLSSSVGWTLLCCGVVDAGAACLIVQRIVFVPLSCAVHSILL